MSKGTNETQKKPKRETMTAQELHQLTESIFITTDFLNFHILRNEIGETFTNLTEAIDWIRERNFEKNIGLSRFEQAQKGNAEWDNL